MDYNLIYCESWDDESGPEGRCHDLGGYDSIAGATAAWDRERPEARYRCGLVLITDDHGDLVRAATAAAPR